MSGFIRHKQNIGRLGLTLLIALGCLPFLMVISRILALPGGHGLPVIGNALLSDLGQALNQSVSLDWVPPSDRPSILYLLLLPTGALIVAFTRMTLGVRVLGLRAILISIGFRHSGILPSLMLMGVVVGIIIVIRPMIRRIRMPMWGRIPVVLTMASLIMIGALVIAPWMRSETVWSVAFFPVIIMAMMAEAVAKTLEQETWVVAVWRTGWTVMLAIVIAGFFSLLGGVMLRFPELILTQLVAIIMISEFLDLRLLDAWPDRLSRLISGIRPWFTEKPRVAVVRNRESKGVIGRLGRPAPKHYRKSSVQRPVDALRKQGFRVRVVEGDMTMLRELERFIAPDPRRGTPRGVVLNLATGVQGAGRLAQVPAMLEMAGIAYSGPDPDAHARLADRIALLALLERAGIAVPRHALVSDPSAALDLEFPLAVRPRFDPDVGKRVAKNRATLQRVLQEILIEQAQPAVVEEIVEGREIRVALVGNDEPDCFPLLEQVAGKPGKVCPAPLNESVAERIRACARQAYRITGCRDYARVDMRLTPFGEPHVIQVVCSDLFARRGSFVTAAQAGGTGYEALLRRVVVETARRQMQAPSWPTDETDPAPSTVVPFANRRAAAK